MNSTKRGGYTLIELIMVLSILIILLSVSMPKLFKKNSIKLLKNEAYQIKAEIEKIRQISLFEKKATSLRIVNKNTYEVFNGKTWKSYHIGDDIIFYDTSKPNIIGFTARGLPSSSGTLKLKLNNNIVEVIIQPVTGRVRLGGDHH